MSKRAALSASPGEEMVRHRLRQAIAAAGGKQLNFCIDHRFSRSFISAVLCGVKRPSTKLCAVLGVKREVTYTIINVTPDEKGLASYEGTDATACR